MGRIIQVVEEMRHIRANNAKVKYPQSTAFNIPEGQLDRAFVGGHSMRAVFAAIQILADFNNAIERGDVVEVRI